MLFSVTTRNPPSSPACTSHFSLPQKINPQLIVCIFSLGNVTTYYSTATATSTVAGNATYGSSSSYSGPIATASSDWPVYSCTVDYNASTSTFYPNATTTPYIVNGGTATFTLNGTAYATPTAVSSTA